MKNKYRDHYQKITGVDRKGRAVNHYVYNGMRYVLPYDEKQKKKTNWMQIGLTALITVLQLVTGMINQDSSHTFWVVYPYIFVYLPLIFLLLGVISYLECGIRIQEDQYDKSIRRIRRSVWGVIVLSVLAAVCDIVYLVLYRGSINMVREVLYLSGLLLTTGAGIGYGICYDRMFAGIMTEN